MVVAGYPQDIITRIINVRWGVVDQQGLLAEFGEDEEMKDTPTAHALDTGETYPGVNMGASGLGYTVLTPGLVCFGKPRDGASCFLASPDFNPQAPGLQIDIKRGTLKDGELKWETVDAGPLIALSFAQDAFFAVYHDVHEPSSATDISTSFDGVSFSRNSVFPAATGGGQISYGGAVAALIDDEQTIYIAGGGVTISENVGEQLVSSTNLAWAVSSNGLAWNYNFNASAMADPGSFTGDLVFGTNQACTIAAGNGAFVAAAGQKSVTDNEGFISLSMTAAAASSSKGDSWKTTSLPGALSGTAGFSSSQCVTFVRTKKPTARKDEPTGYFLCAGFGRSGEDNLPSGGVWRSDDGDSWSSIVSNKQYNWSLSAIAKDPRTTTIVHI